MKARLLVWWARVKKYEPTNLVKYISGGLKIASAFNWIGFSQAQLGVLDVHLPLFVPIAFQVAIGAGDWFAHRWLRSKVSPEGTTEPMAEAILDSTTNPDATPTPEAVRAAQRVKAAA